MTISNNKWGWLFVTSFKGISQVIFIDNAVSGFIMLIAITLASYPLGIIALISSMVGTLVAKIGGADNENINQGLFGYNSVLTGMALSLFLTGNDRWLIAVVGAAIAAIVTAAMMHFMRQTNIPILTFPFIVITWFLLLSTYRLVSFNISSALIPQSLSHWTLDIRGQMNWLTGALDSMGQIFFLDHALSGILLFIAVFWAGWRWGLYAMVGTVAALLTSYFLRGEHTLISHGLYGYNAVLTMLAVSEVFKENHRYSVVTGIFAACLTIPITASIDTWLLPYGLPALTMPFVVCTWIFLAARNVMSQI
ncbi:urea transporter [Neobacillus drentensis]|uniref:urea transporter n=1 Tax=Neobacillus drentensis TaxID=220684 RepID=UPI001F162D65|nr:urea transporter [Neobacillus drentensis]ULT59512.1 urea transporter [Neobacillus drentensis]